MERHEPGADRRDIAFVFAGGDSAPIDSQLIEARAAIVIAADSGLDHAARAGIPVDLVVGDMDSVTPSGLRRAEEAGAAIERHPADKDATDLELALDAVVARGIGRVVVLGGGGGRLSHLLGNAVVLGASRFRRLEVEWRMGATRVYVLVPQRPLAFTASPGDLVSIIALEPCSGVTTAGLVWSLEEAELSVGTSRGISNRLVGTAASVSIETGVLLVIVERGDT